LTAEQPKNTPSVRTTPVAVSPALPFEQAVAITLSSLQQAIAALLAVAPGDLRRAADVERTFDLDTKLAWQIHGIATAGNPIVSGTNVPAASSMRRFFKVAAKLGIPDDAISNASQAFDEFERLVQEHAGDRERFVSMIGGLLDEEGEDLDLKYKKAAYRAMSHIWGAEVRTYAHCMMLHPGRAPDTATMASVRVYSGVHRLRASAPLCVPLGRIWSFAGNQPPKDWAPQAFGPIAGTGGTFLLQDHCSPGLGDLRVLGADSAFPVLEVPEAVGLKNSVTIASATVSNDLPSIYVTPGEPEVNCWPRIRLPMESLLADVLIHQDAIRDRQPVQTRVRVYGNDRIGPGSDEPEYTEQIDLLSVRERCEYRGRGLRVLGTPDLPRHVEMLESVCGNLGWNPEHFHAYRCRVAYPLMRSGVRIDFVLTAK
jgi:hypothetical protein